MRKDSYYEDDEDLARQRELIEKRLKSMSYDDEYEKSPYSQRSSNHSGSAGSGMTGRKSSGQGTSSSSARAKGGPSYSDGKVRRITEEEIEYAERRRSTGNRKRAASKSPAKKRKKKHPLRRFIITLAAILVIIAVVLVGTVSYMFSGITTTELDGDLSDTGGVSYIKTIALFGVDSRDAESTSGRSDSIMVMSVNKKTGEINLISVLRDSYVEIDGYGSAKINAAYSYGGASLAVKTLNQSFSLDITDYITVNFSDFAAIVNAVGGVTIEITAAEAEQINSYLDNAAKNSMTVEDVEYVDENGGTMLLNGDQAVAYSRIRLIDSDIVRASRQQTVLSAVLTKIKEMSVFEYPSFIHEFLSVCETSLTKSEMLSFAPLIFKGIEINTYTVPDDDYETDLTSGYSSSGQWCWFYDTGNAGQRMHSIIYGD